MKVAVLEDFPASAMRAENPGIYVLLIAAINAGSLLLAMCLLSGVTPHLRHLLFCFL